MSVTASRLEFKFFNTQCCDYCRLWIPLSVCSACIIFVQSFAISIHNQFRGSKIYQELGMLHMDGYAFYHRQRNSEW